MPKKKSAKLDVRLGADLRAALDKYAERKGERPGTILRMILREKLQQEGVL